ncbi:glycoside hydrolase family 5 protein [Flaviramulus sp. BrNp1-15]|uniref:glycoside hydrolase family 5 protein n=1 Tax=Flaviramulus sp. BrNp1-15 TaxID=2916754 RepID=UPI001EE883EA|nr:glycoside hydrolase family 5 protein [Flaviramulus sp. BrNp1-15]ULC58140.1 glycoside hydrolase family 5 protein [Flaviramulus sp. BrNp1-15]
MILKIKHIIPMLLVLSLFIVTSCNNSNDNQTPSSETDDIISEEEEEEEEETPVETFENAVEEFGQLSVSGNKIIDKNGNPVQLRGMSFFWSQWIGKYYTKETVKWLKEDWNCNIVRAAMAIDHDGYLVNPEVEKAKVKTVIDAAIEEGIYVLIDWHDHEAENHLEEAKTFFSEIAKTYGDIPNIIYETYNEPLNVSWKTVLKPYHEAVIEEIRKYDPDNIIVCGTRNWSQNVDDVIGNKIDDNNVAYTLHYYAATHKQELRNTALNALNNDIPLFVTEFGTTQASGDVEINEAESKLWWAFLDEHKISWCNWSIADKEELAAALKPGASATGGWPESEITTSGKIVRNELKAKNKSY